MNSLFLVDKIQKSYATGDERVKVDVALWRMVVTCETVCLELVAYVHAAHMTGQTRGTSEPPSGLEIET